MALQLGALRDALIDAGATPEKAAAAAEELVGYVTKADLAALATKADLAETKADLLKWVIGAIGLQTIVIIGAVITISKLFVHG